MYEPSLPKPNMPGDRYTWWRKGVVYGRLVKPGSVVDDRFEIERVAGKGGGGIVYRAVDRATGQPVAIKTARTPGLVDSRFAREIETLAQLRHPHIVSYLAHGTISSDGDDDPYLVMEWLDGI